VLESGRFPMAGPDASRTTDPATLVQRMLDGDRLALAARCFGGEIGLRHAGPELLGLIRFVGLDDVLAVDG